MLETWDNVAKPKVTYSAAATILDNWQDQQTNFGGATQRLFEPKMASSVEIFFFFKDFQCFNQSEAMAAILDVGEDQQTQFCLKEDH